MLLIQKIVWTRRVKPIHQAFIPELIFLSETRIGLLMFFKGTIKHLGYFQIEKEAAKAYNESAAEHFGEFAKGFRHMENRRFCFRNRCILNWRCYSIGQPLVRWSHDFTSAGQHEIADGSLDLFGSYSIKNLSASKSSGLGEYKWSRRSTCLPSEMVPSYVFCPGLKCDLVQYVNF